MSINGVSSYQNWWQWQSQPSAGSNATTTATTRPASDSITNTGSLTANSNVLAFMQAFSADLQTILAQSGSGAGAVAAAATPTAAGTTAATTDPTAANQAPAAVHPHHHHHPHGSGEDGSMNDAAQQLAAEIDPMLQNGSLSAGQVNQSASVFATDVMQALRSYGTTAPTATGPSILA